ncbi:DUF1934 domain-containing protein [Oceanobacillus halotolerans]|uniref:DUF1934 domain-containing protein n=1 Tax=Oceanobacillus halotolerans TaxID=2663380 RepID=UPI0013DB309D|nr:DUF1934 domain-containing protein [Oceanobacillus halotolerans]
MGRKVHIELNTTIEDDGQTEQNTLKEKGYFYQKGNIHVLTYDEKIDEAVIKTMITIQQDKVSIKRTGMLSMHQQFHKNQLTENVYQHPHGNIHMETYTKTIDYQALTATQTGQLQLRYHVKLNGQQERKHELRLWFTEEEAT